MDYLVNILKILNSDFSSSQRGEFKVLNIEVAWGMKYNKSLIFTSYVKPNIIPLPMWLIRIIVIIIYERRQFKTMIPEFNSLAYKWISFEDDVKWFWNYTILHREPKQESEDELLGRKKKEN